MKFPEFPELEVLQEGSWTPGVLTKRIPDEILDHDANL